MYVETMYFTATREGIGISDFRYDPYRGRGFQHLTWQENYQKYKDDTGVAIVADYEKVADDLNIAADTSAWYWNSKHINTYAERDSVFDTARIINLPGAKRSSQINGYVDRETAWKELKKIFKYPQECANAGSGDADIEFHIKNTGTIEYKINNETRASANYYYHDALGTVHDIGKINLTKVVNNHGDLYADKLGKDSTNVYLADIQDLNNYSNGNIKFSLTINTTRPYINDVALASFLGAMINCGYTDFVFNGFSGSRGESPSPSTSHKNGMNGDLRYLRTDQSGQKVYLDLEAKTGDPCGWKGLDETRQNNFNDALDLFGWGGMLSWKFDGRLLNQCVHYAGHNNHLHLQSYSPTVIEKS